MDLKVFSVKFKLNHHIEIESPVYDKRAKANHIHLH